VGLIDQDQSICVLALTMCPPGLKEKRKTLWNHNNNIAKEKNN